MRVFCIYGQADDGCEAVMNNSVSVREAVRSHELAGIGHELAGIGQKPRVAGDFNCTMEQLHCGRIAGNGQLERLG